MDPESLHAVWLLLVAVGLFIAVLVSKIAQVRSRRTASRANPIG